MYFRKCIEENAVYVDKEMLPIWDVKKRKDLTVKNEYWQEKNCLYSN